MKMQLSIVPRLYSQLLQKFGLPLPNKSIFIF